jgi:thioredoxin reductase
VRKALGVHNKMSQTTLNTEVAGTRGPRSATAKTTTFIRACAALAFVSAAASGGDGAPPTYSRYLVLGAGPGGLQLAHFLASAGRDYLVLDAEARPASFFDAYPRWRQLISINKREVGRADSLDFAQRHDWNSLLSDASHASPASLASSTDARASVASLAPELRFTSWSDEYFPRDAGVLAEYLRAWAAAPAAANASSASPPLSGLGRDAPLRIRFNSEAVHVSRIETRDAGTGGARFRVDIADGAVFTCRVLVVATGLRELVPFPSANGTAAVAAGLVHTYANAPADAASFRGKRVLLLGHGNAAFEFAHNALQSAAYVHIAGRAGRRVRLALETHYPGDVRHVHGSLLETYNLKSLDGITSARFERLNFARGAGGGVAVAVNGGAGCALDAHGRATGRCSLRAEYDIVVACLGWRMARGVFAAGALPELAANKKHPLATPRYESANVPGMFFAGTLAHAVDHKRASGGFIHGFRYTARALHRILEEEEADLAEAAEVAIAKAAAGDSANATIAQATDAAGEVSSSVTAFTSLRGVEPGPLLGQPPARWPSTRTRTLRALAALLLRRLNSAAGLYQMFGQLVDVFVLDGALSRNATPALAGFSRTAPGAAHAAMEAPWSFFDASAAAAAASDPTGLAADIASSQSAPPAGTAVSPAQLANEAAIDAALAGGLREEVPIGLAAQAARAWADREVRARDGAPVAHAEWLTLALEFGPSPPPGRKDPFAPDRANVDLRSAERSAFIHPVLRYFSAGAPGCGGGGSSAGGAVGGGIGGDNTAAPASASCLPVAELHVVEDFFAAWGLHVPHVLPLARFLQELGARRAAAGAGGAPSAPRLLAPAPWPAPSPPPRFLASVLSLFIAGCDATLFVGGARWALHHEAEGWWLKLSVAAELSLSALRAVGLHAVDRSAPGLPLTEAERMHTEVLRARWATARAREAAGDFSAADEEGDGLVTAPEPPALSTAQAVASAAAERAASDAAFGELSARLRGLAVLVVNARAGECRLLVERTARVQLGGAAVLFGDERAAAADAALGPLRAAEAAQHMGRIFDRVVVASGAGVASR